QGRRELAVGSIAQPRRLRHDLVVSRVHVVGELDLYAGPQSIGRHADGGADDAGLADRRVEAAARPEFLLQALRAAEHATEVADILAEHDDVVVALHADVHGVADRLDHRPARHGQIPACWRWRRKCGGMCSNTPSNMSRADGCGPECRVPWASASFCTAMT